MRKNNETVLILIRHGDTLGALDESDAPMAGWTDVQMSAQGTAQVERLALRLARAPRPAALYSSPLSRARQTAEALARQGMGPSIFCEALKEIHCGDVDGMPVREVQRQFPQLWQENLRQDREDFRWPGGETYQEFRERCVGAVRRITARHPSARIALVTHAGVISQIIGFIHGLSPARWQAFRPGNASVTEIRWRDGSARVAAFDCRAHLEQPA